MPSAPMDAWKARLKELQLRTETLRAELSLAESELETHRASPPPSQDVEESKLAPEEKIQLFRSLFIGRDDV